MRYYKMPNGDVLCSQQGKPATEGAVEITKEEAFAMGNLLPTADPRVAEVKARLTAIDLDSMRPLRAIVSGDATQADTDKLIALEHEAIRLRAELTMLTMQAR